MGLQSHSSDEEVSNTSQEDNDLAVGDRTTNSREGINLRTLGIGIGNT